MQILKMVELIQVAAAGVSGVPTVIIYKKGIEVDRKVGGVPREQHERIFRKKYLI